ncbi:hypothetical protein SGM_0129 [Streptomyces griseoaurantiacus M045]|uniref:Uncharacterized protein n=1 Tax=Streptomyces griseoaurantiacus M045 TaxID=996637 RepID=F3N9U5_9ACTN|nr:hypothetical protein SGM_0129 [Streptomyces griseoaurantiacus M045]
MSDDGVPNASEHAEGPPSGRKITAARGAVPGIGDPDRHVRHSPRCRSIG